MKYEVYVGIDNILGLVQEWGDLSRKIEVNVCGFVIGKGQKLGIFPY